MAGYAFFNGFKVSSYWSNTTGCFDHITNLTYLEFPDLNSSYSNSTVTGFQKLNLTTTFISNTSATGLFCSSAVRSAFGYWSSVVN